MSSQAELLLLDTNVVVQLVRWNAVGQRIDRTFGLLAREEKALISVVTVGECHALAAYRGWGSDKRNALNALLHELVIVDIHNGKVLAAYAEIDAFLKKTGRAVGNNDVWVAACARVSGAILLTTDKDFDPLDPKFIRHHYISPDPTKV
jgi:tRNA(fMet)-specific endonuclease VapC